MPETPYNETFLRALDALPLQEVRAPLSGDEFDRILAQAQQALPQNRQPAAPPAPPRKGAFMLKTKHWIQIAAAACLVLLGSVNLINPAFAESLPAVGGLFAWINSHTDTLLPSEQLDLYATEVNIIAEADADAAYTMTLRQIYCDDGWLRLAVELSDPNGSLRAYDTVWFGGEPLQDPHEGNGMLAVTLPSGDTEYLRNQGSYFTRIDDHTFAGDLNYFMYWYGEQAEQLAGQPARLVLNDLVARVRRGAAFGTAPKALPGSYTMAFTFPALNREGQRTARDTVAQNGLTVEELTVTPAATHFRVQAAADSLYGGVWDSQAGGDTPALPEFVLQGPSGEIYRCTRYEGFSLDGPDGQNPIRVFDGYFTAVPEDVSAVTLLVYNGRDYYDKPRSELEPIAAFTLQLA